MPSSPMNYAKILNDVPAPRTPGGPQAEPPPGSFSMDHLAATNVNEENRLRQRKLNKKSALDVSLESVDESAREKLLDFDEVRKAANAVELENEAEKELDPESKDDDQTVENKDHEDEFQPFPQMNIVAGFLRLAYYICACTVLFGIIISLFYPRHPDEPPPRSFLRWQHFVYHATGWVQVACLVLVSGVSMVDSVATLTFRWKEYGELTHNHADATSILFLLCPSRWALRLMISLILATAVSLRSARVFQLKRFSDHDLVWYLALSLSALAATGIGFVLNVLFPCHRVAWLEDTFQVDKIEDKGDVWIRSWHVESNYEKEETEKEKDDEEKELDVTTKSAESQKPLQLSKDVECRCKDCRAKLKARTKVRGFELTTIGAVASKVLFFSSFVISLLLHGYGLWFLRRQEQDLYFATVCVSFASGALLSAACVSYILYTSIVRMQFVKRVPHVVMAVAPFCLSSSVRFLLESEEPDDPSPQSVLAVTKIVASYLWIYLMAFMFLLFLFNFLLSVCPPASSCNRFWRFLARNVREEGVNKKIIRFFDTLGSLLALAALVFGMASILIDQYDLNFEPDGFAKEVADTCNDFHRAVRPLSTTLKKIIKSLDLKFTCDEVYAAVGTGTALTLFASLFPGASSVVHAGSKSAYYGVRLANSMTNLASRLRHSLNLLWQVAKAVYTIQKFTIGNFKKLIVLSNFSSIAKLLPFMPPVVLGMYVLFAAFWPKRILFFSAKQRRSTVAGMLYTWILTFLLLVVAILINTALMDEIVTLLDENIPLTKVTLERKLGFYLAMVASSFSFASCLSFCIAFFILKWQTFTNHENITNAELDWKYELEKRELVRIRTAMGDKLEKRTQLKYKKERIGPWTWVLPILICLGACGFGYLANVHPKLEFQLEPKGRLGYLVDRVLQSLDLYEFDKNDVKNDTSRECLPIPLFKDVLKRSGIRDVLLLPVDTFFNETERVVKPLRDVLTGMRKQLLLDVQDELFGGQLENVWNENHLQYLGLLFMVPRALCLLVLLFGCLVSNCFVCQMRIIQAIEPKRIVSAYGKIVLFSVVYVIGAQLALFNLINAFGLPFYHINLRFGLGFIYDVVADFILTSLYIGMKNEFFFAIPKRKTVVVYSIPGASDEGPNVPGQII